MTWLEREPSGAALLLVVITLAACRVEAEPWADQRQAGPFLCVADFRLDGIDGLVAQLAQLQNDLVRDLGVPAARERIELYLFQREAAYRQFLHERLPEVPYRRALYVKSGGVGRVFAHRSGDFEIDLRHECTHALLHAVLPMVPLWLDEGLAKYYEQPPEKRVYDNPYFFTVRWSARFGLVPSLAKLEKKADLTEMGGAEYRNAWAWVHFMLHGPPAAREELIGYLADIRASAPPGQLSDRLQRGVPRTERAFAAHFKGWSRPRAP